MNQLEAEVAFQNSDDINQAGTIPEDGYGRIDETGIQTKTLIQSPKFHKEKEAELIGLFTTSENVKEMA